ncbi:AtpZ/AtpI family protein [Paenibacillus sp. OAS669]|uniref:AtpZ/AtpI family protein n=1 Tax=Paenibacillus sp. OAS669 TaxID=2663821 RepID=UPI00178BA65F|nr:AtpZ/AtpI family protein [Paenibacillus sp. OAS669]MBE1447285.1 F0F1-type ATP synthase assembly protein I [Paenibacillus sp. OAS669]
MKQPNRNDNPWRAAALSSAIGIDLVVCLLAGYWFGDWLSHTLGGQLWLLGGFLLGLVSAIISIYFMIKQYGGL